jgi:hypothetical protein
VGAGDGGAATLATAIGVATVETTWIEGAALRDLAAMAMWARPPEHARVAGGLIRVGDARGYSWGASPGGAAASIGALADAVGLGAYAAVGIQRAANAGISLAGVILIGLLNAIGGGLLRDVLIRREPEIFRPGTLLASAALIGCFFFVTLTGPFGVHAGLAGWLTVAFVFAIRVLSPRYNVRTTTALGFARDPQET